jgi:hypothetical protein
MGDGRTEKEPPPGESRMDRSYHRAAYEHHSAKAAVYRRKAESHLARASAHRSHLGFGGTASDYGLKALVQRDD